MLRRDRNHRHLGPAPSAALELERWRAAAQRVARAWDAWLAVDWPERARAYATYLEALADEELAARRVQGATVPLSRVEQQRA
jgi:hypothetical protein